MGLSSRETPLGRGGWILSTLWEGQYNRSQKASQTSGTAPGDTVRADLAHSVESYLEGRIFRTFSFGQGKEERDSTNGEGSQGDSLGANQQ